jgi:hypothetical protein
MAVEGVGQPQRRAAVAGPDVGEAGLQTEERVVKLRLEAVVTLLVISQAGLDGQHADIAAFSGEPLNEIEAEARLLHDVLGHQREELERTGSSGIRPDGLELEVEKSALGMEAGRGQHSEKDNGYDQLPAHGLSLLRGHAGFRSRVGIAPRLSAGTVRVRHRRRCGPGR